jgi:head-tail adaptor
MKRPHLNRRLMLERPERVADGAGGFNETWTAAGQLWAEVSARTGAERRVGGAARSQMRFKIVVRNAPMGADSRPSPDQRFREGDRVFVIRAVAERDPARMYLTCFADEEVAV